LIAGAVGALGSWMSDRFYFYICNYLLALSGMYFFIVIPYFLKSQQQQQERQSVPLLVAFISINTVATGIRVGILEAPYDTKRFTDPFHWYLGCLFAYCVFANIILCCRARRSKKKQGSKAPETSIEEFGAVDKH
jgi:hypothetical protein